MTTTNRDELLAVVERSPQAVALHDRDAWVKVFTADGRVEDPVGSSPHIGHDQIYRFYDTFIGPRGIRFHRDLDIVRGQSVLRDLELEVAMGTPVTMYIPAFLRYDLRGSNGDWQVERLRAYWELPAMMLQFLKTGTRALTPGLALAKGLLGNQGPRGTVGFMTGFRRAGTRHKKLAEGFLRAVRAGDTAAVLRALSPGAPVTLGDDDPLDAGELIEQIRGTRWTKLIGAGSTVVASVSSDHGRGILFADVPRRGHQINAIRYFPA
ncbi:nuclear transport factor 2 family protein [Mycobacterium vicinigordonae]|uniref:Nuclear transport factor 2 family protein n=1 Tax=Mycobacterium vicinigordonae TaxID=1719132 RepID=A0A7D6HSD8_9MYCO|nr:nuclear transport factor 2 family protein [Mycobacterium vicinigordonae]QLL05413.1 nuclear transport factor 2 family protein [Mycobacterium vicinigordonae]